MKKTIIMKVLGAIIIITLIAILLNILSYLPKEVDYNAYAPFSLFSYNIKADRFTKIDSNIPKINAAVATYPFASSLVESTISKESYNNELQHVSTTQAYQDIINNVVDISIASETNQENRDAVELDSDIVLVPIAKEELVIYVNKDNPISFISIEELNNIYSGKISNWKGLGGKDEKIYPYQLKPNVGGSEECFARAVPKNTTYNNSELVAYDMKNIIDLTAGSKGGIGYAFNLFYSKLYNQKMLKKIATDTPLLYNVYFIYRKSYANPNIEKILTWLLSDDGQNFVTKCGYAPIK